MGGNITDVVISWFRIDVRGSSTPPEQRDTAASSQDPFVASSLMKVVSLRPVSWIRRFACVLPLLVVERQRDDISPFRIARRMETKVFFTRCVGLR